jgi:glycosyltransferase involved in cell wall biosynthesis
MVNPMVSGSGMRNKVLEAFALGLPVVSTTLGLESVPKAIPGEHFVLADAPKAFAAAVLELNADQALRGQLRNRAHALVMTHYTWSAVSAQWRALFDQIGIAD